MEDRIKAIKVQIYPNLKQKETIDKTIGCSRFIYNQMLAERINVYEELKDDKEKLYKYKYKTEKEYKQEFTFLKEASSRALQQARNDLDVAYKMFYKRVKSKKDKVGFPKFKSKKKCKLSYREPQLKGNDKQKPAIEIIGNKIKLLKLGNVRFSGFKGTIKSSDICNVTITKSKSGKYFASIAYYSIPKIKVRTDNKVIGIDLGLKDFVTISDGRQIKGIQEEFKAINKKIDKQNQHLSRKTYGSKNYENCKIKLNRIYEYRTNFLNHFQWSLANYLLRDSSVVVIEDLAVKNMIKNRKLSKAIHNINWSSFITKLKQKSEEYGSKIVVADRFFPSSKMCSKCGALKSDLTLADRTYKCSCGNELDRDLNASINLRNLFLLENNLSLEYNDYNCGERLNPRKIVYNFAGTFEEAIKNEIDECNIC